MAIIVNLRYTGKDGSALRFAEEMITSGTVDKIRAEKGNLRYEYYRSVEDPETVGNLVRKVFENFRMPYFSLTPTFSICPVHGYIPGDHETCPYDT